MREKLNENPIAQVALVGVLLVAAIFVFISSSGGSEESEEAPASEVAASVNGVAATGATPGEAVENAVESLEEGTVENVSAAEVPAAVPAPPPPRRLTAAYESGKTVVLLIVHKGSVDSSLSARSSQLLKPLLRHVSFFIVSAKEIARYSAITLGLDVNRVPALVVMKPKRLSDGTPQASVDYGVQSPQSVLQAVIDANYHGREVTYHPN